MVGCLGLAAVMWFVSVVMESDDTCGQECASATQIAVVRWVAVALVFSAIALFTVAVSRSRPPAHLGIHCYGCGSTTEVRPDHVADDLVDAGWVSEAGRTFCPRCAEERKR